MLSTVIANCKLSTDDHTIELFGLKGQWNPDGTWASNIDVSDNGFCIADHMVTSVEPGGMSERLRKWFRSSTAHAGDDIRVTAHVAVMLFLEGSITSGSLAQVREEAGEVIIPCVRVDGCEVTLRVIGGNYPYMEEVTFICRPMLAW